MLPLQNKIFSVNDSTFEEFALEVFKYQFENVDIYRAFCQSLKRSPATVKGVIDIPFLPIEFFKSHKIIASSHAEQKVFESSGTTGVIPSRHYVADVSLYEQSFILGFEKFYGGPTEYVFLALLPSYIERGNSSLTYMADKLIGLSGRKESGFFLNDFEKLNYELLELKKKKQKTILLGVSFALLDFSEMYQMDFPELIVMETGGMKGRREELTREEVHYILKGGFGVTKIHSEYGMTELLSQAYSKGNGIFDAPPWMKILARDVYDPMKIVGFDTIGAINLIDFANLFSCSFIATSDLGRVAKDGSFEVLGRVDNAELRGCNLMVME